MQNTQNMQKERSVFWLGIVVAILPFLGFPETWQKVIFFILGFTVVWLAYLLKVEKKAKEDKNNENNKQNSAEIG